MFLNLLPNFLKQLKFKGSFEDCFRILINITIIHINNIEMHMCMCVMYSYICNKKYATLSFKYGYVRPSVFQLDIFYNNTTRSSFGRESVVFKYFFLFILYFNSFYINACLCVCVCGIFTLLLSKEKRKEKQNI